MFRAISVFVRKKITINENVSFTDHVSGIQLPDCSKLVISREFDNNIICRHDVIVNFFDAAVFLLSLLVTCPSFMSISLLALELQQFSCIRDWPEIQKLQIPSSEFWPISGDWVKLGIPNLALMSSMKSHWML